MKYRIEVQQVFGMVAQGLDYDSNAEWAELDVKPRGKSAALAMMRAKFDDSGFKPPIRVVAVDALGDRVEVARIESPHKPAPQYVVEVSDAQGEKRQECATLADARQLYTACVDGAQADPRKGYTRRVSLIGLASGDTYFKWEYQAPQAAPVAQATKPVLYQVFEKATGEAVGKKYHNRNGADTYCDGFQPYAPGCYEVRQVQ